MVALSRGNGTNFDWLRKSCDVSTCDLSPDGNPEKYRRPIKSAIDPLEEIAAVSYILPPMLIGFGLGLGFCSRISPWCSRSTRGNSSSKLYIATYVNRLWVRVRVLLQDFPMVL